MGCEQDSPNVPIAAPLSTPAIVEEKPAVITSSSPSIKPKQDDHTPTPASLQTPKPIPLTDKALNASLTDTSRGFRIELEDARRWIVMQSISAPRKDVMVHVLRITEQVENATWYRKDILIVDPDSKTVRTLKLMHGCTYDSYTTDTVTGSIGFLDDEHIVYVAVHGTADTSTTYNIEKINIYTGETTVLFEKQPEHASPDFFTPGWLNSGRNKLALPSFREGKLRVYDLNQLTVTVPEQRFPSFWPYYAIHRSPDGDRLWHDGKLYDLAGNLLAEPELKGSIGLGVSWSPDNRYSAMHYAYEDGVEHRLPGGESDIIAPQGLMFLDPSGGVVHRLETNGSKVHLELIGWVPERQTAIVQYYEIDKKLQPEDPKTNVTYQALNLVSGAVTPLTLANVENLNKLDYAETWSHYSAPYGHPFFADLDSGTYWRFEERSDYLGLTEDGGHIWSTIDYRKGMTVFYHLSPLTRTLERLFEEQTINTTKLHIDRWLMEEHSLTYMRND